ncbi:hypothetical protein PgNI_05719 [Pyricularia grisea]|uniref:FAD-binding PCMH-type domain-containing protein n=1 Tax=Pyricularia grisea TaxID=148305 RepID=A0A6P8B4D3_PYRGI|nr:hypothetical protein PgNI_05719 [Pyricularia grisea]TLD10157.1 hypothetical protein PgNI_05719 [Pyricularia grisea]
MFVFTALSLMLLVRAVSTASQTCDYLKANTKIPVETDHFAIPKAPYSAELDEYWSKASADLKPSCVVYPTSAEEASQAIRALSIDGNNDTFAIKSGGLSANDGFNSVKDGTLISTRRLTDVRYDADKGLVRVATGNRWTDVQKQLDPFNVTVAGARVGEVGVGGYMSGGGFSFHSPRYGWGVNSLAGVEIVLANGTIVTASKAEHADLFAALKGGTNNFGLVTAYIMEAIPIGQVWGGLMAFTGGDDKADKMMAAIAKFTNEFPNHPKAGIIPTVQLVLSGLFELWVVFFFYDGPTVPAGVFDDFLALSPLLNTCKTQNFADLLAGNSAIVLRGTRYKVATETAILPDNAQDSAKVMRAYYDHWAATSRDYKGAFGLTSSMAIQSVPKAMAAAARARGGDLIDMDDDVNRLIYEYDLSYLFAWDDDLVHRAAMNMTAGMKKLVDSFVANGTTPDAFRPLFANDVYRGQDYFSRLRPEKRELAARVSRDVDPTGLFRTRTGGWKP